MKILVFTGTRADYGIMFWLLKDLDNHPSFELELLVSGAHLCNQFGDTYKAIEQDGITITRKVDIVLSGNTPTSISKSVGLAIISYGDTIDDLKPDAIIILGDRYEAFAMAQAAFFLKVPIVHLHGGEVTEGANDDRMRHAITKLSDLHLTSTESHRCRVIQLGEQPHTVVNVGAPGLEHIYRSKLPTLNTLSDTFDFDFSRPYILIAFHPVTNSDDFGISELRPMLKACSLFENFNYILSFPNADMMSSNITQELETFREIHHGYTLLKNSYGHLNFLSIIKHCSFMIGNSSSAIIEAPSLSTPSIDVGMRQHGRERAKSVYTTSTSCENIEKAIRQVLSEEYSDEAFKNPYENNESSNLIIDSILRAEFTSKKQFHDIS